MTIPGGRGGQGCAIYTYYAVIGHFSGDGGQWKQGHALECMDGLTCAGDEMKRPTALAIGSEAQTFGDK